MNSIRLAKDIIVMLVSVVFTVCGASAETITANDPVVLPQLGPLWGQLMPFQSQNGWDYAFVVGGPGITSIESPYYGDWLPNQATVPEGWTFEIVSNSTISGPVAIWKNLYAPTDTNPYLSPAGASFSSAYAPTNLLMTVTMNNGNVLEFQYYAPLTPSAEAAGYLLATLPVPEPSELLLGMVGLTLLAFVLRKDLNHLMRSP